MKNGKMKRRKFLLCAALGVPAWACADSRWIEPEWLKVRTVRIKDNPTHRIVQFTDVHHKGDRAYLEKVVSRINSLSPDAVCFTGDLVEEKQFLPETLEVLGTIKTPMYGVPGNHDYWSHSDFHEIAKTFAATGGGWLLDSQVTIADGKVHILGATCLGRKFKLPPPKPDGINIMLLHYPLLAEKIKDRKFDLLLAGHSHGGQVRIPFYGAVVVPYWVGKYEMGMYHVPAGPLYVNPGIGYIGTSLRFNCRPEITVFEI